MPSPRQLKFSRGASVPCPSRRGSARERSSTSFNYELVLSARREKKGDIGKELREISSEIERKRERQTSLRFTRERYERPLRVARRSLRAQNPLASGRCAA